jgi:hypothetical protein
MPNAHSLPLAKRRPAYTNERPSNHALYQTVTGPTYRTIALFFCCTTSSSRSFTAMTRFVQWPRASFNTRCENEKIDEKESQRQGSSEFLPHRYAPGSPALQVDDGVASVPFLSNLQGQKLLALKVSQQDTAQTYPQIASSLSPCSTPSAASPARALPPYLPIFSTPVSRRRTYQRSWPGGNASGVRAIAHATYTECETVTEHWHTVLQMLSRPVA